MPKRKKRRRSPGEGTVIKRRGVFITRVKVNGEIVERHFDSYPAAEQCRIQLSAMSKQPSLVASQITSLKSFLDSWLNSVVKLNCAESTYANYETTIRKHINPGIGHIFLARLEPHHISEWIAEMADQEVGSRTRQNAYAILRAALEVAATRRQISDNPCRFVPRPKHEREEIDPFTVPEIQSILSHAESKRLAAIYHLGFRLGPRIGELLGLRWSDINLDEQTISIQWQACEVEGKVTLKRPKSKAGIRTLDIDSECVTALVNRQAESLKEGLRACEWVFPNRDGNVMHRSNFGNRHWANLLERAEIRHRGFHHVRHTAATMMLKNGTSLGNVSAIIGHSKPSTTLDIYGHFVPRDGQQAVQAISRAIAE